MADPAGEADRGALRLDFDRRLMLRFRGSVITSDGGLLAYRELDDALALTASGGERLAEARTGRNRRHLLVGLLRQSVFGRLAGYEDVNDAERLCRTPARGPRPPRRSPPRGALKTCTAGGTTPSNTSRIWSLMGWPAKSSIPRKGCFISRWRTRR